MAHEFNGLFTGENLSHVAFPIGGLGAGMFCLEGTGALGSFSIENKPDVNRCPNVFAAIAWGGAFRVLEGPVPERKVFGPDAGNGLSGKNYGLPRFPDCGFLGRFPFAHISLSDDNVPFRVNVTGFSPFAAREDFVSSLPFGALEYEFIGTDAEERGMTFYFQCENWFGEGSEIFPIQNGFVLRKKGTDFCVFAGEAADIDAAWFRGGWWDAFTTVVSRMEKGLGGSKTLDNPKEAKGATLSVPFVLAPGQSRKIRIYISWFSPESGLRAGEPPACGCGGECAPKGYEPWYAGQFSDIFRLNSYIKENIARMETVSREFSERLFASALPPAALEAVSANLSILKSPSLLRLKDGRLWGWEGCGDRDGCCHGSCTHVYNYAQAVCRLFPGLERGLREIEFFDSQDENGHQQFRANLPVSPPAHNWHAASDGQLGGIVKVYREWKISGDDAWLANIYPRVKQSLAYCIRTWDPSERGVLTECHHNTFDIEFYGADIMCTGFYLAALTAMAEMAGVMGADDGAAYSALARKGKEYAEKRLYNGEYFFQETDLSGLKNPPGPNGSPEERELFAKEGPKYQYGTGCLSDGLVGIWLGKLAGLKDMLDADMVKSHLLSVYRYNFRPDLSAHVNPQRPGYALGKEGGLLVCSWPRGGKPTLPFVYCDEVWTGVEYEIASFLILEGFPDEAMKIIEAARARYDGKVRNPFDEYECGHWYVRALSSYALMQAFGEEI